MAAKGKKKSLCVEINLLPAEDRQTKLDLTWIVDRRVVWPTIALLVALVAVFMVQSYISETTETLQNRLDSTREEVERQRPILDKITALDAKLKVIAQKNTGLKSIQVSKKRWVILFENISSMMPPNMWLVSLNQVSPLDMELRGVTYDFSEVAEYMVKLEKQASFKSVTLTDISTTKIDGEEAYSFVIKAGIKPDLGLEGGSK
ncbi:MULTISPECIES: PilN domain-containing protein [Hallerella]|uniref:Type IV pilus assembly protein PilN n=1 Tax=Hallerella succinigenes TaxID=1896222 RepID=A0A2M9A4B7_9BACT|nr:MULTISPECIES: PilN domain-containing protein [Hallerella]MBS7391291.1 PilN domain-containing protein [Fibrobacter sp.]MCI6874435.1 PilN domain-containing protein [Hallerella sp.]MDD6092507.1 PilN domain-containing protein [Hallerella succinigenes]MDY5028689.1 PilN domain-containing protein [Hallerella succinigenes]PJJ40544.1 type IV pilus assembly protein PilN [Hallerella succinigenes]